MIHSLLLIACSQRKIFEQTARPAWDVYDGVIYRVLKKRLGPRGRWPTGFEILIVSAKYGVIRPEKPILPYDQKMTAAGKPGRWARSLKRAVADRHYHFVHMNLGRAYVLALGDLTELFAGAEVTSAAGGIGQRAAQTATWVATQLSRDQTGQPESIHPPSAADTRPEKRRRNPPDERRQSLA